MDPQIFNSNKTMFIFQLPSTLNNKVNLKHGTSQVFAQFILFIQYCNAQDCQLNTSTPPLSFGFKIVSMHVEVALYKVFLSQHQTV